MAHFEAFAPRVVVDDFARKIDALCIWGNTLIVGLSDGSLLFFNEQQQQAPAGGSGGGGATALSTWQVTRMQKGFAKRGLAQLQTLEAQEALLSLSGAARRVAVLHAMLQRQARSLLRAHRAELSQTRAWRCTRCRSCALVAQPAARRAPPRLPGTSAGSCWQQQ